MNSIFLFCIRVVNPKSRNVYSTSVYAGDFLCLKNLKKVVKIFGFLISSPYFSGMKQSKQTKMTTIKTATYRNTTLNETYKLLGIKDLPQAWRLAQMAADRNGWNVIDITKITIN